MPALSEADFSKDPVTHFRRWLDAAARSGLREPTAMALATVSSDGRPAARMVLLKSVDDRGFVFTTNYESRKAAELTTTPQACLLFHWAELERQVRVEGGVERITASESDAIFRSRPRGARLAAWASPQSRVIVDRGALEQRWREAAERHATDVPRPPFWGGYRLEPRSIEFWQGRAFRLHDRLRYVRTPGATWTIERLAP